MQGTAEVLPFKMEAFDAVASSYLAKYVDMRLVARECFEVLRPGGTAVFHDFTLPRGKIMHALWQVHFRILRLVGMFTPSWRFVFDSLEKVIAESFWEDKAVLALREAGFVNIRVRHFTAGTAGMVSADKP
jgi:ubiquinone/menaquinone biosynthesis C-methylase UbiE